MLLKQKLISDPCFCFALSAAFLLQSTPLQALVITPQKRYSISLPRYSPSPQVFAYSSKHPPVNFSRVCKSLKRTFFVSLTLQKQPSAEFVAGNSAGVEPIHWLSNHLPHHSIPNYRSTNSRACFIKSSFPLLACSSCFKRLHAVNSTL